MELKINNVILFHSENINEAAVYERILWIHPTSNKVILIKLNKKDALPFERCIKEISDLVTNGKISILEFYENSRYFLLEESIPQNSKLKRDIAWDYIRDIVNKEPEIYVPSSRSRIIKELCSQMNVTNKSIYKYLRKYWQNGKIKNSLLPNYNNCGGKGKEKPITKNKRGRNRVFEDNPKSGINITSYDIKLFDKAIKDFYYNTQKLPLKYAYEKMIFRDYLLGYNNVDGIDIPVIKPASELPTFTQFQYWCNKKFDIKKVITSREGEKIYELKHRPVLGTSTSQAFGPGSRFQIDATISDVYLVNRLTRDKVLKRVTIYAILDVFSRLVVGIYVGCEPPSWIGASMALANAGMDKVKFCKDYGINIDKSEWPCENMCELLTADRGELEGDKPNNFINTLGVDVEILPPYRADWKGIIEFEFRRLNLAAILWLPGSVKKRFRERGEKDYRLDAALTLTEFTTIIINCVIRHNNQHRMKWYERTPALIADKVPPIPIQLWNWGMVNCTGRLKKFSEEILKLNLMPSYNATVTSKGIKFNKHYYSCDTAIKENWFAKSRLTGSWSIPISYDPRKMDYIYIRLNGGTDYEKCYQTSSTFKDFYYEEVEDYIINDKKEQYGYSNTELQSLAQTDALNSNIVKSAIKLTNMAKLRISDRQKIKSIKNTTKIERQDNQLYEAFDLKDNSKLNIIDYNEIPWTYADGDDNEYIPPAKY